ncbi:oleate hydratase [Clostridium folliculivorans]|uniref:Oleate hydratase n=1 Tax=Clostridium folliculivorans TaxID=2886038 RepID=A0A9W5Y1M5_9CLOT|nr:oleate hydratase [Clostridium folliculivorans]GKU24890.1 oleate hydratase [Clostridium folliculivorans]GKU30988.1 oleate hydratase [Clostridium folliculivorans]
MKNYERISTVPQNGIENKKAYLVGGGIGSLASAAFLIRDGHMPAKNIHILEESNVFGGSMDGAGNAEEGYIARGGRELESRMECLYDLFGFIPSLTNPDRTVLDEFRELNIAEPIKSHCRLVENKGQKADFSTLGLELEDIISLNKLVLAHDDEIGAATCEQWFKPHFFETNFWYFWRSMFAFENWHSVLEVKRYMVRFMHLIGGMNQLDGILHTEYNQYDSLILPLITWLKKQGVVMELGVQVIDLDIRVTEEEKTVERIYVKRKGHEEVIETTVNDLVFVTNGSMTENSTLGDTHTPALLNRNQKERGCWSLWENIAKQSPDFGHPEVFAGDIDKTKWLSFTVTITDNTSVFDHLLELTGDEPGMGGVVTIKDSNWLMSWVTPKQPHFINQPENVQVMWAYGLFPDKVGDFVNKKMSDCTGAELFTELLYHMGLGDKVDEILPSCKVIPCMMPYITSQFMPRKKGDRPAVIPNGCTNLAFLGQFSEIPNDCVFTVEYSVRSAIMAVYGLLKLDKEVPPVYEGQYDVRVLLNAVKTMLGNREISIDRMIGKLLFNTGIIK